MFVAIGAPTMMLLIVILWYQQVFQIVKPLSADRSAKIHFCVAGAIRSMIWISIEMFQLLQDPRRHSRSIILHCLRFHCHSCQHLPRFWYLSMFFCVLQHPLLWISDRFLDFDSESIYGPECLTERGDISNFPKFRWLCAFRKSRSHKAKSTSGKSCADWEDITWSTVNVDLTNHIGCLKLVWSQRIGVREAGQQRQRRCQHDAHPRDRRHLVPLPKEDGRTGPEPPRFGRTKINGKITSAQDCPWLPSWQASTLCVLSSACRVCTSYLMEILLWQSATRASHPMRNGARALS